MLPTWRKLKLTWWNPRMQTLRRVDSSRFTTFAQRYDMEESRISNSFPHGAAEWKQLFLTIISESFSSLSISWTVMGCIFYFQKPTGRLRLKGSVDSIQSRPVTHVILSAQFLGLIEGEKSTWYGVICFEHFLRNNTMKESMWLQTRA